MSAYVVSRETMDKIMHYIANDQHSKYIFKDYGSAWSVPDLTIDELSILGDKLWAMNRKAVGQRYNEKQHKEVYEYSPSQCPPLDGKKQALSFVQSLIYQCSEGNVPHMKLYNKLELYAGWLAQSILYDQDNNEARYHDLTND